MRYLCSHQNEKGNGYVQLFQKAPGIDIGNL